MKWVDFHLFFFWRVEKQSEGSQVVSGIVHRSLQETELGQQLHSTLSTCVRTSTAAKRHDTHEPRGHQAFEPVQDLVQSELDVCQTCSFDLKAGTLWQSHPKCEVGYQVSLF